jgi:hypothetical protein
MRLMIIGMLAVLIGSTSAFAQQQQKPPKSAATQTGCPNGYDRCVKGGMKMGYSASEAGLLHPQVRGTVTPPSGLL